MPQVNHYVSIPKQITLFAGQTSFLTKKAPVFGFSGYSTKEHVARFGQRNEMTVNARHPGQAEVVMNIAGFPIKKTKVKVLPELRVIPGGQSIGVKLNSVGVLVVGHHLVSTNAGMKSPGKQAGVKVGDIITKINGQKIEEPGEMSSFIARAGKSNKTLQVTILRNQKKLQKSIRPVKDPDDGEYKIGLYIRDSAAGIGTLTFYHPKTMKYGALGHVISDMDTHEAIKVHDGKILRTQVTSIRKGNNGQPGEKIAKFSRQSEGLGTITENTPFGIYGKLLTKPKYSLTNKPIPIALSHQVKEGPAKIYTVIHGHQIEAFDVKIVSSIPQKFPATKGLVIKVTDPELLKATGGIVQGMSGSPIIQDGKLVGAVTHVFVNDPTTGYGVHIEWMLKEAGIFMNQKEAS